MNMSLHFQDTERKRRPEQVAKETVERALLNEIHTDEDLRNRVKNYALASGQGVAQIVKNFVQTIDPKKVIDLEEQGAWIEQSHSAEDREFARLQEIAKLEAPRLLSYVSLHHQAIKDANARPQVSR